MKKERAALLLFLTPLLILGIVPLRKFQQNRQNAALVHAVTNLNSYPQIPEWEVGNLLREGADPNSKNAAGLSVLGLAAQRGNGKLVERLEAAGAKPDALSRPFLKALRSQELFWAVEADSVSDLQKAFDLGADPNWKTPDGDPILCMAIENEASAAVSWLLANGAKAGVKNRAGLDVLPLALKHNGNLQIIAALEKAGAKADPVSALMIAVLRRNPTEVARWLDAGVPVDAKNTNNDGWTALMWAASSGDAPGVELLLRRGANPKIRDFDKKTALEIAQYWQKQGGTGGGTAGYARVVGLLKRAK